MKELNPSLNKYIDVPGYFYLSKATESGSWRDTYFSSAQIQEANNYIQDNRLNNCYSSIATFYTEKKSEATVNRPLELYADIDSHIQATSIQEARDYVEKLKKHFGKAIPEPSYIVYTGRGFQLHFELKKDCIIDVTKWKITQKGLVETIDKLVSEINVLLGCEFKIDDLKDFVRPLRIPETYNTKARKFSALIYESGKNYTLEEIMENYTLIYTEKKGKKTVKVNVKDFSNISGELILKASETELKKYRSKTKGYTLETLARARVRDLLTLIRIRNNKGIAEGYRNNLMNILCESLVVFMNNGNEIKAALDLFNREFLNPLSEAEVRSWIQLKSNFNTYYYKTSSIIERLQITEEEQEQMKTLIRREKVNSTYYQNNAEKLRKNRNRKYLDTKDQNEERRKNKIIAAQDLRKQGFSIDTIATALKISRRTVFYYLKEIV